MRPAILDERPRSANSTRLVSLDVMRGATIAFMILVNNNGDERHAYSQLGHAVWNGWTATDLIFPTFMFLVGISIVFSFESRLGRGASKKSLFLHALRRAAILFLLGLVVNGFPHFHWHTLRIYGVLQRISICFFLASVIYLSGRRVGGMIAIIAFALIGYWVLLRWVPVPGFGRPGVDIPLFDPSANLAAYIDRLVFPGRLYNGVRDPEGLLSTLPALATMLLGVLTGVWLRTKHSASQKAFSMALAGAAGIALGLIWGHWFPINKNLWTSSYVLFAAGFSAMGLAICYWAVEIKRWTGGWTWFWLVFGSNSIAAYVLSELLGTILAAIRVGRGQGSLSLHQYLFLRIFAPVHDLAIASLLYSICFILVCFLLVAMLHRKKIFLKV